MTWRRHRAQLGRHRICRPWDCGILRRIRVFLDQYQSRHATHLLPFTDGNPAYGLQLHHPRFLELVGAPESARLLDCSPSFWVEQLGKEEAMAAAINLQRDAGVMLSNLQILSQFAMAMNRMSFSMMALSLGQLLFPKVEVNDLAPAPRAARAASYMSAMGLWHPQTNPGVPGPVPVSSCHSCMSCKYCFPEDRLPPG